VAEEAVEYNPKEIDQSDQYQKEKQKFAICCDIMRKGYCHLVHGK